MLDQVMASLAPILHFPPEILYGEDAMLAPAEDLPHPTGRYERVESMPPARVGSHRNRRMMAAPTRIGDAVMYGPAHEYFWGGFYYRLVMATPEPSPRASATPSPDQSGDA